MPKCILVVDDDRGVHELAEHILQDKGYEVITAQDGQEALTLLAQKIPDLILLDIHMPNMDGYTFIIEKSGDPAIADIPVIVLTSMNETEPLFKRHGVRAYLLKPINSQDLLDKIQAIVPA